MVKYIKNSSKYLLVLSIAVIFSACGSDENEGANNVSGANQFVSASVVEDVNTSTMLQVVKASIDPNAVNAFGYKAVKITYNTTGENDEAVVASGLLVIPTASDDYQAYLGSLGKTYSVSMICDNHGTIFTDAEAPSNVEVTNGLPDYSAAVLMTGYAGFAAVLPDYIGYGASSSVAHPYMLKESSAEASLDMIKASIYYMEQNGIVVNYQLYISGYSQGGHTAMALAEEVEDDYSGVNLMGVAAMAGPHDLEALADLEIDASHTMMYPAFLGYLADSYAFYDDDIPLSDIVVESNTTMYHNLFDGSNSNVAIHSALGLTANNGFGVYTADALFKSTLITDYQSNLNTGAIFREELIENSTYAWTPKTKVNLIHCIDDEIIPFTQSENVFDAFTAKGVDVTLTPIPSSILPGSEPFVHADCGNTAYGAALTWFDAIRQGNI